MAAKPQAARAVPPKRTTLPVKKTVPGQSMQTLARGGTKPGGPAVAGRATSPQVASEAAQLTAEVMPTSAVAKFSLLISRKPALVLGICSVLIVMEVLIISHLISQMQSPEETPYFNKGRYITGDLDNKASMRIPSDSLATGTKNPIEDAFGNDYSKKAEVSEAKDRVNEELK